MAPNFLLLITNNTKVRLHETESYLCSSQLCITFTVQQSIGNWSITCQCGKDNWRRTNTWWLCCVYQRYPVMSLFSYEVVALSPCCFPSPTASAVSDSSTALGQNVHTTVHSTFHKNIPSPKDTALHLQNNSHKTACTFISTIQHFDNSDCETLCNLHYFGDFTI